MKYFARDTRWLLLIGGIVLLYSLLTLRIVPDTASDDFAAYLANALNLMHGRAYGMAGYIMNEHFDQGADTGQGTYPPGYPIVAMLPLALFGVNLFWIAVQNCILMAAAVVLWMLYARPLVGAWGAAMIGVVIGFSPIFHNLGDLGLPSEPLFLALLALFFLAERALREGPMRAGGALGGRRLARGVLLPGLLMAAVGLTRVVGVLLGPSAVLADLIRFRRLTLSSVLVGVAALGFFGGSVVVLRIDYLQKNALIFSADQTVPAAGAVAAGEPLSARLANQAGVVASNLRQMPGNIAMLWSSGGEGDPRLTTGLVNILRKALTLALVGLALAGFVLKVRRDIGTLDMFFVLHIGLLLNLTELLMSPRYWMPVSLIALIYILYAAAALVRWVRLPRPAVQGAAFAGLLLLSGANYASLLQRPAVALPVTGARAQAFFAWVRDNVPADSVLVSHRPRTMVFFTGRRATDYHQTHMGADFTAWRRGVGGDYLVLYTDQLEVQAIAGKPVGLLDDAALNRALDLYQMRLFAGADTPPKEVFRNSRFRLFRFAGP